MPIHPDNKARYPKPLPSKERLLELLTYYPETGVIQFREGGRFICAAGRVLAYSLESFPTDLEAAAHAKAYRTAHWAYASTVDHRMGACI